MYFYRSREQINGRYTLMALFERQTDEYLDQYDLVEIDKEEYDTIVESQKRKPRK